MYLLVGEIYQGAREHLELMCYEQEWTEHLWIAVCVRCSRLQCSVCIKTASWTWQWWASSCSYLHNVLTRVESVSVQLNCSFKPLTQSPAAVPGCVLQDKSRTKVCYVFEAYFYEHLRRYGLDHQTHVHTRVISNNLWWIYKTISSHNLREWIKETSDFLTFIFTLKEICWKVTESRLFSCIFCR